MTTAEERDALPVREHAAWVAAVLRFMREGGYTVTAPGQEPAAYPADAIVIDRAELPEVIVTDGLVRAGRTAVRTATIDGETAAVRQRRRALEDLSMAEYLDAHPLTPPVDEADVEALAGLVDEAGVWAVANASSRLIARRLLATGRVQVTHE